MRNEIPIVIADDHPIFRRGLCEALDLGSRFKVVAEAADGEAALVYIQQLKPVVAILDMNMPALDGLGVVRAIRQKGLPVEIVFLTIHDEEEFFDAAMELGAKGYLLKDSALTEVVKAVQTVAEGKYYVSPFLSSYLVARRTRAQALTQREPGLADLTPTERRVLRLVAQGKSSKSIAEELFIHYRTVENHRTTICQKLGLRGHIALVKFAIEHRLELH